MTTKIEWTHRPGTTGETWNPVTGCTKVSEGCHRCYAERMARRLAGRYGYPEQPRHFDVTLHPDRLEEPLRWRKPRTVFVCSMGDLFHEDVPIEFIDKVFAVMALSPAHTFQVLTKRPDRMKTYLEYNKGQIEYVWLVNALRHGIHIGQRRHLEWPLANVWCGTTAENQRTADERIPLLLQTPAAVQFVSCEPLLSHIDLVQSVNKLHWLDKASLEPGGIDWAIVGGESGPGARPMHPEWARSIQNQCQEAGVAFLFKQWGAWAWPGYAWSETDWQHPEAQRVNDAGPPKRVGKKAAGRLLDGREYNEWPK